MIIEDLDKLVEYMDYYVDFICSMRLGHTRIISPIMNCSLTHWSISPNKWNESPGWGKPDRDYGQIELYYFDYKPDTFEHFKKRKYEQEIQ